MPYEVESASFPLTGVERVLTMLALSGRLQGVALGTKKCSILTTHASFSPQPGVMVPPGIQLFWLEAEAGEL